MRYRTSRWGCDRDAIRMNAMGGSVRLLVAVFFILSLGVIALPYRYHSDERFYTDAAIRMVQDGDYVTPRFLNGRERFQKPGGAYWVLAASYHTLGVGLFSSRLPFLVGGCLLVLLAVRQHRELFGTAGARFVAPILLTNTTVCAMAWRSTPDVWSALLINVSLFGFARLLLDGHGRRVDPWLAYAGAGLAVLVKGGLGLLPVGFAWTLALFMPSFRPRRRDLVHGPAMIAGIAIAASWFFLVLQRHGLDAFRVFFSDQVGGHVPHGPLDVLKGLWLYLLAPLRHFLPWTLLLAALASRSVLRALAPDDRMSRALVLAIGWMAVMVLLFSFGSNPRPRYLLPMYPLVACILARLLQVVLGDGRIAARVDLVVRGVAGLIGVAGVVLLAVGIRLDAGIAAAGLVLAVLGGSVAGLRLPVSLRIDGAALAVLAVFAAVELAVNPVFVPAPEVQQARRILEVADGRRVRVGMAGQRQEYQGRLHLLLRGRADLMALRVEPDPWRLAKLDAVTFPAGEAPTMPDDFEVEPCGNAWPRLRSGDLWDILRDPDPPARLAARATPAWLALRAEFRETAAP